MHPFRVIHRWLEPGVQRVIHQHHRRKTCIQITAHQADNIRHLIANRFNRTPLIKLCPCKIQLGILRNRQVIFAAAGGNQMPMRVHLADEAGRAAQPVRGDFRIIIGGAIHLIDNFPCKYLRAVPPPGDNITQPLPEQGLRLVVEKEHRWPAEDAAIQHIIGVVIPVCADIRPLHPFWQHHRRGCIGAQRLVPQQHKLQMHAIFRRPFQNHIQFCRGPLRSPVIPCRASPFQADKPGDINNQARIIAPGLAQFAQPAVIGFQAAYCIPRPVQIVSNREIRWAGGVLKITSVLAQADKPCPVRIGYAKLSIMHGNNSTIIAHLKRKVPQPCFLRGKPHLPHRVAFSAQVKIITWVLAFIGLHPEARHHQPVP